MTVTLNISNVRAWETSTSGTTGFIASYTKKDYRVATIKVSLLDSTGAVKGSITIDVKSAALNTPTTINGVINNGLSRIDVAPTAYLEETVAAGSSKTYSVPTGEIWIIDVPTGGTIKDSKNQTFISAIVPAGESVTVTAASTTSATVRIFKFSQTAIPSYTFSLKFEELDSSGTVLWSQTSTTFIDFPPVNITGTAGDITVTQVT